MHVECNLCLDDHGRNFCPTLELVRPLVDILVCANITAYQRKVHRDDFTFEVEYDEEKGAHIVSYYKEMQFSEFCFNTDVKFFFYETPLSYASLIEKGSKRSLLYTAYMLKNIKDREILRSLQLHNVLIK